MNNELFNNGNDYPDETGKRVFATRHFRKNPANATGDGRADDESDAFYNAFRSSFYRSFVKNAQIVPRCDFSFHQFSLWFDNVRIPYKEFSCARVLSTGGGRTAEYKLRYSTRRGGSNTCVRGYSGSKEDQAYNIVQELFSRFNVVFQMDKETDAGLTDQESTVAGNTIMTRDEGIVSAGSPAPSNLTIKGLCNTEESYEFPQMTDRFQPLAHFSISSSDKRNSLNKVYRLPDALYATNYASNILPFKNFIYSDLDIEIRVVVNGPKFAVGKLILSSFPDPYDGFDTATCLAESMLQRDHVLIDLSCNNEGVLRIPNQYKRTFVRNYTAPNSHVGIDTGRYASAQLELLSPFIKSDGCPNSIPVQVFYRFVKCEFAGMSFGVEVKPQMDDLISIGTGLFPELKPVERILKRVGVLGNQDKPYISPATRMIPQPRLNFGASKGASDNIPLFLDPSCTVSQLADYQNVKDPKSVLDIARIWGLESIFKWSAQKKAGEELYSWGINPVTSEWVANDCSIDTTPTPLKFVSSSFAYWSGTLECKIDFVSNAFHTGTIQVEICFNRQNAGLGQSAATYTKTFDLGDQKTMEFTIPYIYDTPMRRTGATIAPHFHTNKHYLTLGSLKQTMAKVFSGVCLTPTALTERVHAYVQIKVINELTPVTSTTNEISCLFYVRAGEDYRLHSLVPNKFHTALCTDDFEDRPNFGKFPAFDKAPTTHDTDPPISAIGQFAGFRTDEGFKNFQTTFSSTGEKITIQADDPTADFSTGPSFKTFHTSDVQTDIKDIIRRPVLLLSDQVNALKVTGWVFGFSDHHQFEGDGFSAYWLPCFVPNHFDGRVPFARTQVSPFASFATLFRHWRGSLCYTFVFKKVIDNPIYVSYLPMSGVQWIGNQVQPSQIKKVHQTGGGIPKNNGHMVDLRYYAETGVATEICLTRINQTLSVRVPFDTNLNKAVVSKRVKSAANYKNIRGREEVSAISGHIVLQCDEDISFDVFVSGGDDMELIDFIGTTHYTHPMPGGWADDISQDSQKVSGFQGKNLSLRTQGFPTNTRKITINKIMKEAYEAKNETIEFQMNASGLIEKGAALVSSDKAIKTVAAGFAAAAGVGVTAISTKAALTGTQTLKDIGSCATKIEECAGKVSNLTTNLEGKMDDISSWVRNAIDAVKGQLGSVVDLAAGGLGNYTTVFLIDLFITLKNFDPVTVSLQVVKYISCLFTFDFSKLSKFVAPLEKWVRNFFGLAVTEQNSATRSRGPWISLCGLMMGIVGTIFGVQQQVGKHKFVDFRQGLGERFTDARGLSYFPAALNFVDTVFSALSGVITKIMGLVEPEGELKRILGERMPEIEQFMSDVDRLTNVVNKTALHKPEIKTLLWTTYVRAVQLRNSLTKIDGNVATNRLLNYCNIMIKFASEKAAIFTCCPVRYEPYVICIVGESNIGKSTLVQNLVSSLLKEQGIRYDGAGCIYTRIPGLKHWDGYNGQPVILYDDWLAISETTAVTEQVTELYCLKSKCDYIPPMANLEEKGMRVNPRLVVLLTNDAFPESTLTNIAPHKTAVYRRRDVLIQARLKTDSLNRELRTMSDEDSNQSAHLEFRFTDPINQELINTAEQYFDYKTLKQKLSEKFAVYDEQEKRSMKRTLDTINANANRSSFLDDPSAVLNFSIVEERFRGIDEGLYPSDLLNKHIEEMLEVLANQEQEADEEVEEQGLWDDVTGWFHRQWEPSTNNRNVCCHCGLSSAFMLGDMVRENANSHTVCMKCAVRHPLTRCLLCEGGDHIFWQVTKDSIRRLGRTLRRGKEKAGNFFDRNVKRFWRDFQHLPLATRVSVYMGLMSTVASLAVRPKVYSFNTMFFGPHIDTCYITYKNKDGEQETDHEERITVQGLVEESTWMDAIEEAAEGKPEWDVFRTEVFLAWIGGEMPKTNPETPVQCEHSNLMLAWEDSIYTSGHWEYEKPHASHKEGGVITEVTVHHCEEECYLKSRTGAEKYRDYCLAWSERNIEKRRYLVEQVMKDHDRFAEKFIKNLPEFCMPTFLRCTPVREWYRPTKRVGVMEKLRNWISEQPEWIRKILKILGWGVSIIGVMWTSYKIYNSFGGSAEQIASSGSYATRHFLKQKRKINRSGKPVKEQSHEAMKEALLKKLHKNYFSFEVWSESQCLAVLNCCGVRDQLALMPRHYYTKIKEWAKAEDAKFILRPTRYNHIEISYKFSEQDFIVSDTNDICAFIVPKTMHNFCNIAKFMAKDKDFDGPITTRGYMLRGVSKKDEIVNLIPLKIYEIARETRISGYNGEFKAIDSLVYNYSSNGACGSMVMREDHTRPILAMHFAGTTGSSWSQKGFGVLISQEMIDDLMGGVEPIEEEEIEMAPEEEARMVLSEKVSVQSLGTYPKSTHIPEKTKIQPSIIQDLLGEPQTLPGFLSPKEKDYPHQVSPLILGCEKHGELTKNFASHEVAEVRDALWNLKYGALKPSVVQPKKLTLREAIIGIPGIDGYSGLHLNTSMGFPYSVHNQETQKSSYIEVKRDEQGEVTDVLVSRQVVDDLANTKVMRESGIVPFLPYIDELKDERRKLAKRLKPGSTRVFCMSSVLTSIPNRQNFLHFSAAYTRDRVVKLNHAVGISTDGPEWSDLVHRLHEVSDNIVTLDYSNFGPGYNAMVNAAGHEIISDWTLQNVEGVNENEIRVLGEEHYHSKHLMCDLVYRQLSGGPSGDALTVVKNGLVNEMYVLLAWRSLMSNWCIANGRNIYESFYELTRLIVYGDDLIMSVHDEIKDLFNGITIKRFLSGYGITATDAAKTGEDVAYTSIYESTFLKCGFKKHPKFQGEWLAPLEEVSITETAKWIHKSPDDVDATRQNAEASLRNAYGHGPTYFQKWLETINKCLVEREIRPIFLTWEELDKNFFSTRYNSF